jgi:transposase
MFWAAFSFGIRTSLAPMFGDPLSPKGGVSSRIILQTLQEYLPTIYEPGSIFIQDNAPTYSCKLVQTWLKEWAAENGVELVDWPLYSPDLNPIENVWQILKAEIIA